MSAARVRAAIESPFIRRVDRLDPARGVNRISGVRVYDVGQGDAIAVLDQRRRPFLLIDYGGREGRPFSRRSEVDEHLPVPEDGLLMLTHWDEDHWCSADIGSDVRRLQWLVPRQITSPRAVRFSAQLDRIHCIPAKVEQIPQCFRARNGDEIWWEKIGPMAPAGARDEDCNRSGVAFAIVSRNRRQAILLPGDAPFDRIRHYWELRARPLALRGVVAFHHGAGTHWREATRELLFGWPRRGRLDLIYSCAKPNTYEHPDPRNYAGLTARKHCIHTSALRRGGRAYHDILF